MSAKTDSRLRGLLLGPASASEQPMCLCACAFALKQSVYVCDSCGEVLLTPGLLPICITGSPSLLCCILAQQASARGLICFARKSIDQEELQHVCRQRPADTACESCLGWSHLLKCFRCLRKLSHCQHDQAVDIIEARGYYQWGNLTLAFQ